MAIDKPWHHFQCYLIHNLKHFILLWFHGKRSQSHDKLYKFAETAKAVMQLRVIRKQSWWIQYPLKEDYDIILLCHFIVFGSNCILAGSQVWKYPSHDRDSTICRFSALNGCIVRELISQRVHRKQLCTWRTCDEVKPTLFSICLILGCVSEGGGPSVGLCNVESDVFSGGGGAGPAAIIILGPGEMSRRSRTCF